MKITLCGSMVFHGEMEEIAGKLRELGHDVKVPLLRVEVEEKGQSRKMSIRNFIEENGGIDSFSLDHSVWQDKANAIDAHFSKVEWADAVLIVNYPKHEVDGYIGGNTLMEIALAWYLKKKIYILKSISSNLSYKEEILGMLPVIINDDLALIE